MLNEQPTIGDFARLAALVSTARHALLHIYPALRDEWQEQSTLARTLGYSESLFRLACRALSHMGWVEIGDLGVRRIVAPGSASVDASRSVLDYYATFAAREFPRDLEVQPRLGDYYGLLDHVAQPTSVFLAERYRTREELLILDYGCGMAPHTRAILRAVPSAKAVLLDRAEVLNQVHSALTQEGLEDRVELTPLVDRRRLARRQFDVVLLLNVLHELPADAQLCIVRELAGRVGATGELALQVFCRDLAPEWHADALEMATAIRLGVASNVLSVEAYRCMVERNGLPVVNEASLRTVGGPANVLFLASKETRP